MITLHLHSFLQKVCIPVEKVNGVFAVYNKTFISVDGEYIIIDEDYYFVCNKYENALFTLNKKTV